MKDIREDSFNNKGEAKGSGLDNLISAIHAAVPLLGDVTSFQIINSP
jgi:hypothetical protein